MLWPAPDATVPRSARPCLVTRLVRSRLVNLRNDALAAEIERPARCGQLNKSQKKKPRQGDGAKSGGQVKGSYREPSLITAKHGRIGAASGNQFDRRKFPWVPLSGANPVSALWTGLVSAGRLLQVVSGLLEAARRWADRLSSRCPLGCAKIRSSSKKRAHSPLARAGLLG
jgi:hypothetical protein